MDAKYGNKLNCNQVQYYEDETAPTGTCGVCVVGGERLVPFFISVKLFSYVCLGYATCLLSSFQLSHCCLAAMNSLESEM